MLEVVPFRGILYNKDKIEEIEKVLTPPYDVISQEDRDKYYSIHPYNIIRIILGKESPDDDEDNNKYKRAAKFFEDWLKKRILEKDKSPSVYIYKIEYIFKKEKKQRIGFIALMKLIDFGQNLVFPHENIHKEPKQDRLNLISEVGANLSPIFSLFQDQTREIESLLELHSDKTPVLDTETQDKVRHRLWRLSDAGVIDKIKAGMRAKKIFIADGHHRYEASLAYRNLMRGKSPDFSGREGWNYVMVYFTNAYSEGLTIFPTHRLIKGRVKIDLDRIKDFFRVDIYGNKEKLLSSMEGEVHSHKFGMYSGNNKFYLLTSKVGELVNNDGEDKISLKKDLDAVILHNLLLDKILNIDENNIMYSQDIDLDVKMVDEGKYGAVFFLNPAQIDDVINIASSGERVPQKVTYFYPKLLTGLVMNRLNEDVV